MPVLIYGDTETSPALRHEVPLAIGDPFLYLEADGRRAVLTNALEDARIARAAADLERLLVDALGRDELIAAGRPDSEIDSELCVRAAAALGITEAAVPPEFPLALADRLRGVGIVLTRMRRCSSSAGGVRRRPRCGHPAGGRRRGVRDGAGRGNAP